ncbi:hypothetical protein NPIL_500071 [Nephila pilipes]|uniref:Uncharacterized protein n=1 Tax=Nephila pilipes TaxID=299642 RepID=A0A8X6U0K0_NEPPI|nr:hypothetical protein NPIL_500071 [Nephila pilipes]
MVSPLLFLEMLRQQGIGQREVPDIRSDVAAQHQSLQVADFLAEALRVESPDAAGGQRHFQQADRRSAARPGSCASHSHRRDLLPTGGLSHQRQYHIEANCPENLR